MTTPILSIIIPVYNIQDYIRECLDSLLKQDLSACEVICVDDGSTDNSFSILDEYKTAYPTVFQVLTQANQGQAAARNAALDIARGEYIAFLDGDDFYLPTAIDTIKSYIQSNSNVDVFYWDCAVTSNGTRYYTLPHKTPVTQMSTDYYDWEYKKYGTTPNGCVWGGIYRRSFLNQYNLRMLSGVRYEDELYMFSMFLNNGIVMTLHLDQPFYHYRTGREGSTVTTLTQKNFIDRLRVSREMNNLLHQSSYITEARRHKVFSMFLQNILEAYQNGFIRLVAKLMTKKDVEVMQAGAISAHEKKLLRLLRISPRLMAAYKTNQLPSIVRRCINVFVK
jgi:glycosyltransferase involved in cell wall biosynthesis